MEETVGNGIPYDATKPYSALMMLTTSLSVRSSSMYRRLMVGIWVFHSKVEGPCLCFPCRMTGRPLPSTAAWFGAIIAVRWARSHRSGPQASRLRPVEQGSLGPCERGRLKMVSPQV